MNNPSSSNNPTEIGLIVISALAIIGAVVLLILGKIDYAGCAGLIGGAFALWGANTLYKAPSPSQQAQLGAQQDTLQQIASQALAVLPTFASLLHSHTAPPQAAQTSESFQPMITSMIPSSLPVASTAAPGTAIQPAMSPAGAVTTTTFTQPVQQPGGVQQAQSPDPWSNTGIMRALNATMQPPQQ